MPCAKSCLRLPLLVSLLTCFSSLSNSGLEYREKFSEPPVFRHISQPGPGSPMGERYSVCTIMSKVPFFSSSMRSARSITRILVSMPSVRRSSSWKAGARISAWGATEADTKSTPLMPSARPAAAISFLASARSADLSARYPGSFSSSARGLANSLA